MKRQYWLVAIALILLAGCVGQQAPVENPPIEEDIVQPTLTAFQPQAATPTWHPTVTAQVTQTPTPTSIPTFTPTVPACLKAGGRVVEQEIQPVGFDGPLEFILYLPPCYGEEEDRTSGYPLLILLHGQTYTPQQWLDIGLPEKMDLLIAGGEIESFVVVMPYESADYAAGFHHAIINALIPALQQEFRLCEGQSCLAIGGISRGGGWALTAAFRNTELFLSLGLHSTPTSEAHLELVRYSAAAVGVENLPRIYVDFGASDYWYSSEQALVDTFEAVGVPYDFDLNQGSHDNAYWEAHLKEYLRWYAQGWD